MNINAPPNSEAARLRRLRELGLHETQDDAVLDVFVGAIAEYCQVPIAFVSVLEQNKQLIKASIGLELEDVPHEQSFCGRLLKHDAPLLEISDFDAKEQNVGGLFSHGDYPVHFYAGHTLSTTDGHVVGSLVVMDTRPRKLSTVERETMQRVARALSTIIDKQHLATYSNLDNIVLRNINQGVLLTDAEEPNRVITYCNDALLAMTGYARAELLGRDSQFLLGGDPSPEIIKQIRDGLDEQVEFTVRVRQPCKDGHLLWADYNTKPLFGEDNKVHHYLSIVTNVTAELANISALNAAQTATEQRVAQRTAELQSSNQALRESQRALEMLLDQAPDATVIVNSSGRITQANARAAQLFSMSGDVLAGKLVDELLPEEFRQKHRLLRTEYNVAPSARSMGSGLDLYALAGSGKRIPVDINLSPIEIDGESYVVAAIRDVSERVARQALVEQARQRAEEANDAKAQFLATASHDLRQPLQSLGIYLSVLQNLLSDEKPLEVCEKMRASLDSVSDMLDVLLDVSRLESGKVEAEIVDCALQDLFDKLQVEFEPAAAEKNLLLRIEPTSLSIRSDPALLQRVLDNLLSNAIKYTAAGSVNVTAREEGELAIVAISDTGAGIANEDLHRIFGEYVQLSNPQRDRRQGLGLGLAIVSRICRLLGHPVHVQSVPGQGSCFSLDIPLVDRAHGVEIEQSKKPDDVRSLDGKRLLLVEDDQTILDAWSMLLQSFGLMVHTANDFDAAIALVDDGLTPEILISDYRLPGRTGVQVIEAIRAKLDEHLPSFLITGDTSLDLNIPEQLADIEVMYKPVREEQLLTALGTLFNS